MARDFKHPSKTIEQAVAHAEAQGWRVEKSRGHAWGDCSARITTATVAAVSFVLPVFGVRQETPKRTPAKSSV